MAGYDPKRPRPSAGGDDPAPVEALIDLADHKSPEEPPAPRSEPVVPGVEGAVSAPEPVASEVIPQDRVSPTTGRLVLIGVVAVCSAVLVIVALRRRRRHS